MAELSKTARAAQNAVNRGQKPEKAPERTAEYVIGVIRNHIPAKLAVTLDDVAVLLAEYDSREATIGKLQDARDSYVFRLSVQQAQVTAQFIAQADGDSTEPGLTAEQNQDSIGQ